MAHEVETMAYAGKVPWHGLGVPVRDDMTPNDMVICFFSAAHGFLLGSSHPDSTASQARKLPRSKWFPVPVWADKQEIRCRIAGQLDS